MTSAQYCELQEVQNNMNSGIRVHFIELCISIISGCIGSCVYICMYIVYDMIKVHENPQLTVSEK